MNQYSQQQYQKIINQSNIQFQQAGYNPQNIIYIPISEEGENVLKHSYNWYHGSTLIEALDNYSFPKDAAQLPLRLPIDEVYLIGGGVGTVPVGRVVSGILKKGIRAQFAPSNIVTEINTIEMHANILDDALPGDMVGFSIKNVKVNGIKKGYVCSDSQNNPARECKSFIAYIVITNNIGPILNGQNFMIKCHSAQVPCILKHIISKTYRRNGEIIEYNSKQLRYGDTGYVEIVPTQPLCVELFQEYPQLGRITIKKEKKSMGVGIIIQVEKIKSQS